MSNLFKVHHHDALVRRLREGLELLVGLALFIVVDHVPLGREHRHDSQGEPLGALVWECLPG
jgi:hypothetical protein